MKKITPADIDRLDVARNFVGANVDYDFSEDEKMVLDQFFTNHDKKVFYVHTLPESLIGALFSMYSRLKNERGIRGHFVDNLLPMLLLGFVWDEHYAKDDIGDAKAQVNAMQSFIKERHLVDLKTFVDNAPVHRKAFDDFLKNIHIDPDYLKRLANAPKLRAFIGLWLDKYGHNSIARGPVYHIGLEQISVLAAKSLEWGRPGAGYIELSTRFVDMERAELYPIWDEMALIDPTLAKSVRAGIDSSFERYVEWMNDEKSERSLIRYFREKYAHITDPADLEVGIKGEVCDVFGNFLPAATTTSVGVSVSGEALPEMLKHLLLDETNENAALVEMVLDEGEKVGADQFTKHLDISDWRWASWQYLDTKNFIRADNHSLNGLRRSKMIRWVGDRNADAVLVEAFRGIEEFTDVRDMKDVIERLGRHQRDKHDKAWNQFELSAGFFIGAMSFRGWRDLHRMGFSTHFRTLLTPHIGFYKYDKPAPLQFLKACAEVHDEDTALYRKMAAGDIDLVARQYPMALGNIVGFQIGANFLQHEFVGWQRTKFNVNHEVREVTLGGELILRDAYWWWKHISRADTVPAYVFARTKEGIPLKNALGVVS